jgi:SEC-C motif domain protein
MSSIEICPCGSGRTYRECCEPAIAGKRSPATAEELMRSRYSAYVKVEADYLFDTTHPDHQNGYDHEGTKKWAEEAEWEGLEIVSMRLGGPDDSIGDVEFIARYRENDVRRQHHEVGGFRKKEGKWYFTEGKLVKPQPILSSKVGRNDPCTCGSGAKYKKCCGK